MKHFMTAGFAMLALSACGGGSTSPNDTPEVVTFAAPESGFIGNGSGSASADTSGNRILVNYATNQNTRLGRDDIADEGTFAAGSSGDPTTDTSVYAFVSETDNSSVALLVDRQSGADNTSSAVFERTVDTMPASGSVTATGGYVGVHYHSGAPITRIVGDASLTANFDDMSIDGEITNRALANMMTGNVSTAFDVSDVTLGRTSIGADGSFNGTTSGGNFTNGTVSGTAQAGSYSGLVAGPDGGEIVGGVTFTTIGTDRNRTERGAFAAGH